MKPSHVFLDGHRSIEFLDFEMGSFTVLFGKNNAGKTNILETFYGAFASDEAQLIRRTHAERSTRPEGAMIVELEPDLSFDHQVEIALGRSPVSTTRPGTFFVKGGACNGSPEDLLDPDVGVLDPNELRGVEPAGPELMVEFLDWDFSGIHERVAERVANSVSGDSLVDGRDWPWLEMFKTPEGKFGYAVPERTLRRVAQLEALASDLLPDFVDGSIGAHVTTATLWGSTPKVLLEYNQRGLTQCADLVDAAGQGAARWMAAAVQLALHLMEVHPTLSSLRDLGPRAFSGHVLLIDEPEAHLHPAAVASMVRWCQRMVEHGFAVVVASHHEEFLRVAGRDVTLVHVVRDPDLVTTSARTIPTAAMPRLQDLADDVGLHPAVVLSLHRAVVFVEGPLDEAVLDEYGGLELDAAGVKIVPIRRFGSERGLRIVAV